MKRRNFLQFLGLASAAPLATAAPYEHHVFPMASSQEVRAVTEAALAKSMAFTFSKEGALHASPASDLTEYALEDAIIALVLDAAVPIGSYVIVVPAQQMFTAARLVAEINRLHDGIQEAWLPAVTFRVEPEFTDWNEWGVIASNGRCWYSPGA